MGYKPNELRKLIKKDDLEGVKIEHIKNKIKSEHNVWIKEDLIKMVLDMEEDFLDIILDLKEGEIMCNEIEGEK